MSKEKNVAIFDVEDDDVIKSLQSVKILKDQNIRFIKVQNLKECKTYAKQVDLLLLWSSDPKIEQECKKIIPHTHVQVIQDKKNSVHPVKLKNIVKFLNTYFQNIYRLDESTIFDYQRRLVSNKQKKVEINLTEKESELLKAIVLSKEAGKSIDRDKIFWDIWGFDKRHIETHTLETHMHKLKQKLAKLIDFDI